MMLTFFPSFAALSTFAKYSGIFACVSKLSIVLKDAATLGPITGRSVADPPQRIITSISSFIASISSKCFTSAPSVWILTLAGSLLVNTAFNSISSLRLIDCSTPRPMLPYPTIPILIFPIILPLFLMICRLILWPFLFTDINHFYCSFTVLHCLFCR